MSKYSFNFIEHNVFWGYSLGVDWSVGIVECSDHVMSEPGARYNGTQPWEGETQQQRSISPSAHHQNLRG